MKAFITGSHAYGTPTEDSDIDLVVQVSPGDLERLAILSGDTAAEHYGVSGTQYLRFGGLNLLAVDNDIDYQIWLEGTKELVARRPVTRDEAVAVFKRRQKEAGRLPKEELSLADMTLDDLMF